MTIRKELWFGFTLMAIILVDGRDLHALVGCRCAGHRANGHSAC